MHIGRLDIYTGPYNLAFLKKKTFILKIIKPGKIKLNKAIKTNECKWRKTSEQYKINNDRLLIYAESVDTFALSGLANGNLVFLPVVCWYIVTILALESHIWQ